MLLFDISIRMGIRRVSSSTTNLPDTLSHVSQLCIESPAATRVRKLNAVCQVLNLLRPVIDFETVDCLRECRDHLGLSFLLSFLFSIVDNGSSLPFINLL
jgi:hypothetical protein